MWNLWCQRVDGRLPRNISVIADGSSGAEDDTCGGDRVGGVQHITTDYRDLQDYLEKATFLLDDPEDLCCEVCEKQALPVDELVVICPQSQCHCIAHLLCLSHKFIIAADEPDQLVPTQGICPACKEIIQWPLMMQELTLRCRGERELQTTLKKKGRRDNQISNDKSADKRISADSTIDETNPLAHDSATAGSVTRSGGAEGQRSSGGNARCDSPLDESWLDALELTDFDVDATPQSKQASSRTEIVIDDSDELE